MATWTNQGKNTGGDTSDSFLLKEDNGFLLLEDGGKIILNTGSNNTVWVNQAKN